MKFWAFYNEEMWVGGAGGGGVPGGQITPDLHLLFGGIIHL